ncbi:MAG: proline dehydrogenase family protein [Akkermansia sp.]|nr:proline dehydrogenase family protein [Akkermansia sp.]
MGELDISAKVLEAKSKKWDDRTLAQRAADMAQDIHTGAIKLLKSDERTLLSALSRLVADEKNREFLRSFCAHVLHAPAEQQSDNLRSLLAHFGGVPTFFSAMGRLRFKAASVAARSMQSAAMAEVRRVFRSTFGELTMPLSMEKASQRLQELGKDSLTVALQPLSPAVFGNEGAERYIENLCTIAKRLPSAGLVVQPLRLCPSLSPCAPNDGAKTLAERLTTLLQQLYKNGKDCPVIVESGNSALLPIVVEGCKRVLNNKEYHKANVMLELPAYLNAAPGILRELTEWATARAAKGGAPLKVLLVKGSQLSTERECAFLYGKESAAAPTKSATETRYKQLVHQAISAKEKAICPVIGTHNPFDIAYALLDWGRSGRKDLPPFTFYAGLGNHLGRQLAAAGASVTLTAGLTGEEGEITAFESYLLQLVNELSRPEGYLTHGYAADPAEMGWSRMRQHFLAALSGREESPTDGNTAAATSFEGTPLHCTDRAATDAFYEAARTEQERPQELLPLTIDGKEHPSPLMCIHRTLTAPSLEDYRFVSADFNATPTIVKRAAVAATNSPYSDDERHNQLLRLARKLEKRRTELAALLVRDAGFTCADAEEELRNAIDAARFYEQSASADGLLDGTTPEPLGVVVVSPGRVHPLSEAVAGIAAAWVMGNSIIYKPAAYTTLLGHRLTAILNEVGINDPQLQLVPCLDNEIACKLMIAPEVDGVITGLGHATAQYLAAARPTATLCSSPAGATTVYISARGDWQQAVRDLTVAAFRRSGQCPTAPHIVLVHAAVYDNKHFIAALCDAVRSLTVGAGSREGARLGPLSAPLTAEQHNFLTKTPDKDWLVKPTTSELNSITWSPGIITSLTVGSPELDLLEGLPVIALIRVDNTGRATTLQRELTAGRAAAIYSLDAADVSSWQRAMEGTAHLCINCCPSARPGLRPFGTLRPALCGCSLLPGGSNFVTAMANWQDTARPQRRGRQRNMPFAPWETLVPKPGPDDTMRLTTAADSLSYWWENEFGTRRIICDHPGEPTELYYTPLSLCLRAEKETDDIDISIALMAALKAECTVQLSTATARPWMLRSLQELGVPIRVENREEFMARFPSLAADNIVVRDPSADDTAASVAEACGLRLSRASVVANGRLELLQCLQEHTLTRRTDTRYTPL